MTTKNESDSFLVPHLEFLISVPATKGRQALGVDAGGQQSRDSYVRLLL